MASSQSDGARTPFQDLTNSDNTGKYITGSYLTILLTKKIIYKRHILLAGQRADPKELKRQRARERYALNKDEINKKRREARAVK